MTDMTKAEKLAALETYLKVLDPMSKTLRTEVTKDMGDLHTEKVGAYLPDGTKMASVSRSDGKKSAKVVDSAAALAWCLKRYPDEIVQAVNPAFLKKLTDIAGSLPVGSKGLDPATGEELPFIEVQQGSPYVTVTTTAEGRDRMAALANGFAGMLEAATDENGGPPVNTPSWSAGPGQGAQYDPAFADRLENGAYPA
jgi:hypothetical protein